MKGHAVANGVYVAAANRIGLEHIYLIQQELNFGSLLHSWTTRRNFGASPHKEEILIAEVDLDTKKTSELAIL
jgi:N-carbamoylputrescine amidase